MSEGKKALERLLTKGGHFSDEDFSNISQYIADLKSERDRLRDALSRLLLCPAIADGEHSDPAWGCLETVEAESFARKTLKDTQP